MGAARMSQRDKIIPRQLSKMTRAHKQTDSIEINTHNNTVATKKHIRILNKTKHSNTRSYKNSITYHHLAPQEE